MIEGPIFDGAIVKWADDFGDVRTGVALGVVPGPEGPDQIYLLECIDESLVAAIGAVLGSRRWSVMRKLMISVDYVPDLRDFDEVEEWLER